MTGKRLAVVMTVLLAVYLAFTAARALDFIRAGGVVPVLLGVALIVLPFLGVWVIWREWRFGRAIQALGAELAAQGGLPADDLPRRASGRPDREAADARFAEVRTRVEADPESWQRWFELAVAYDQAGDRKRARSTMKRAIALHERSGAGGGLGGSPGAGGSPGSATDGRPDGGADGSKII
jgi:cytochrome c-type biogenesis protein CcmH/NrfG